MPKLFDYKFLITLGLSLVVYFLYREVENLNKRVAHLESKKIENTDNNKKKLIELPLPPPPTSLYQENTLVQEKQIHLPSSDIQMQPINRPSILEESELPHENDETVEEYSNEHIDHSIQNTNEIYSHDNLNSDSHNIDSLMVDSILNMVKKDDNEDTPNKLNVSYNKIMTENNSNNLQDNNNLLENNLQDNNNLLENNLQDNNNLLENNLLENDNEPIVTNISTESNITELDIPNQDDNNQEKLEDSETIEDVNILPKVSLDSLLKLKLDELQEKANDLGLTITLNGKKKKKADLANEIFDKINLKLV
jgi:hypothetical protein